MANTGPPAAVQHSVEHPEPGAQHGHDDTSPRRLCRRRARVAFRPYAAAKGRLQGLGSKEDRYAMAARRNSGGAVRTSRSSMSASEREGDRYVNRTG